MDTETTLVTKPKHRLRRATRVLLVLCILISLVVIAQGAFVLRGSKITVPTWVTTRLETAMSDSLGGREVSVGRSEIRIDQGFAPKFTLYDVQLFTPKGDPQLHLDQVQTDLNGRDILSGAPVVRNLRVRGVTLRLLREEDGQFNFQLSEEGRGSGSLEDLTRAFNESLSAQSGGNLEQVNVSDVNLLFEDKISNRAWLVDQGFVRYRQNQGAISFDLDLPFTSTEGALSAINVGYERAISGAGGTVSLVLSDVSSKDLAAMSTAVGWLDFVDAPISGSMRLKMGQAGEIGGVDAALELGSGFMLAGEEQFGFRHGKTYFSYKNGTELIDFTTISFASDTMTMTSSGQLFFDNADVNAGFLGQLAISELRLNPRNLFKAPQVFDGGQLDFRVIADPFRFHVGQLRLNKGDIAIAGKGRVENSDGGWSTAVDLTVNQVDSQQLLDLWPDTLVSGTRDWLTENLRGGMAQNAQASLRLAPGKPVQSRVSFDIENASLRFLPHMPPLEKAFGHGSFENEKFSVFLSRGQIDTPKGALFGAGSTMTIDDVRIPPVALFDLQISGNIDAAAYVLNKKPLEIFDRAGRVAVLGRGQAKVHAIIDVPLLPEVQTRDVDFMVKATIDDVNSDSLVPNRVLTAAQLSVSADPQNVRVFGDAKIDGVPMTAAWEQEIQPNSTGISAVSGQIELSANTVDAFHLGLPEGSVSGKGRADFTLALDGTKPPILNVTSDLDGVAVSISALGWAKPAGAKGDLRVKGILGEVAEFPEFELAASGLRTSGRIALNSDGLLQEMVLDNLVVGNWLRSSARLIGRGAAVPKIVLSGGLLDIRGLPFASEVKGEGGPIDLSLDNLKITDSIQLTGFKGEFSSKSGISGAFRGRVNGGGRVEGSLVPTASGAAIRLLSDQAGELLRSAGVFQSASGGTLNLTLRPRTASRTYDGSLSIKDIRLREAPAVASLLSAISVVGLLDQLGGDGILFSDVQGKFQLTPNQIFVSEASAVGPAMGISADGVYELASGAMNFQGVISPIYVLNGLGQIFSRNREGLFGFNYRLQGTRDNPKTSVNPLSILTPGIFREIFRQPMPKLSE